MNTHQPSALYETFPPEEVRRILRKLDFHYTPKHGSWLNMAEIEISIIERGCLSRPVGAVPTLYRRVKALETERNAAQRPIQWRFTSAQAREKLSSLYPVVPSQRASKRGGKAFHLYDVVYLVYVQ